MKTVLSLILLAFSGTLFADSFTTTASMSQSRINHTATLLADGRVFIAGGSSSRTCEIYDPATHTFRTTAAMSRARSFHTATLLNDGRVLIAGGRINDSDNLNEIDNTAELFDPLTETFSPAGNLVVARYGQAATRLPDGRVLITGGAERYFAGFNLSDRAQAKVEVYNPLTNTFSAAPDLKSPHWFHTATAMPDGSVFVTGCTQAPGPCSEKFAPGALTTTAVNGGARRAYQSATLLDSGLLLIAGGNDESVVPRVDAEIYQSSSNTYLSVNASSSSVRQTSTLLHDGRVLFTGWSDLGRPTNASAIYSPTTNTIAPTVPMHALRFGQTATLLADGKVLIAGGGIASAELFDPSASEPSIRRRAARK